MPTQNVDAMAIEKASWMAWTMSGMSGWISGLRLGRHDGEDPCPRSPVPVRSTLAPARELVDDLLGHARHDELGRDLGPQPVGEDRAGDRQADRPADLLEEREAARRDPDPVGGHGVLDDQREDRERRTDAEAGEDHPEPEHRAVGVGVQVA